MYEPDCIPHIYCECRDLMELDGTGTSNREMPVG